MDFDQLTQSNEKRIRANICDLIIGVRKGLAQLQTPSQFENTSNNKQTTTKTTLTRVFFVLDIKDQNVLGRYVKLYHSKVLSKGMLGALTVCFYRC